MRRISGVRRYTLVRIGVTCLHGGCRKGGRYGNCGGGVDRWVLGCCSYYLAGKDTQGGRGSCTDCCRLYSRFGSHVHCWRDALWLSLPRSDSRLRIMEHIDRYPELARNIREYNEITFSLSIYAPDRAVKAYAELSREMKDIVKDIVGKKPTNTLHLAKLTFELRRTVLPSTKVTEQDIKDILED